MSSSTVSFAWTPGTVSFADASASPSAWTYSGPDAPPAGGEHVHLNPWLYKGAAPANGKSVEVVIKAFHFTPAS